MPIIDLSGKNLNLTASIETFFATNVPVEFSKITNPSFNSYPPKFEYIPGFDAM